MLDWTQILTDVALLICLAVVVGLWYIIPAIEWLTRWWDVRHGVDFWVKKNDKPIMDPPSWDVPYYPTIYQVVKREGKWLLVVFRWTDENGQTMVEHMTLSQWELVNKFVRYNPRLHDPEPRV